MVTKKRNKAQSVSDETNFTTNIRRTAVSLAVAAALPGAMVMSTSAMAQEAESGDVIEEIVSYGKFRRSLIDSISTKRNSSSIVEALSAEDIGKLPDSSIAESLSRLPGLAGERRNGRTSGISVRGFREDYVGTTMNGRELLGIGDNRGVEYDLYPSEIISGVVVSKTPDASMTTQGIGGIVDMRTTRPLDATPYLVVNANYEVNDEDAANPEFDDTGHRLALAYSDVFADDTVGLALAFATTESPSQETQFRGWNYTTIGNASCCNNIVAGPGVTLDNDVRMLEGHDSFVRSATLERDTVAAVLQFAPNDDVTVTLDALYIDFKEDKAFRGVEEAHLWGGQPSVTILEIEDNFVTRGSMDGFHSVVRNDLEEQESELTTFGINVEWNAGDDWLLKFDAATSEADKRITNVESYAGTGRSGLVSQGPRTNRTWTMTSGGAVYSAHPTDPAPDLTDWNVMRLSGPQAWGGDLQPLATTICPDAATCTATDGSVLSYSNAQDGFVNEPTFDEELTTAKLSGSRPIEWGAFSHIEAGINYSDRSKSKVNYGAYLTAATFPNDAAIPEQYRMGTVALPWLGIDGVIAYDSLGLFKSGFYTEWPSGELQTDRLGDTYEVDEQLLQAYVKLDFDTEWGNTLVTGNVGVQFVDVDQEASGFNAIRGDDFFVDATSITDGDDYTDVLPSVNVSFEVADGHIIRTAVSKTVSRPRMDDMRPNNRVDFNSNFGNVTAMDPASGPWSASAGNARLEPLEANQFDVSYEWYFSDDGFVSAAWFYKDLTNWHRDGQFVADFTEFYIPGFHQAEDPNNPGTFVAPATFLGVVNFKEDGLEGSVQGWEVQGNVGFGTFSDSLEGLGLIAAAAFYDGDMDDGSFVPGLSEESYSATMYYERGGFQGRVSWTKRSKFETEFRGLSLALDQTIDQGAELVDAQIGYDFGLGGFDKLDGLYISLQAQNLTDEDTAQTTGDSREFIKYQGFGSNYLLNVNYRFK